MKLRKFTALLLALLTAAAVLTGCDTSADSGADTVLGSGGKTLRIVSGSENRELEPILEDFAKSEGVRIEMTYQGSLDIMRLLEGEELPYDAVWPASSLWLDAADTSLNLKHAESVSITPVVFGIRQSLAQELGLVGKEVSGGGPAGAHPRREAAVLHDQRHPVQLRGQRLHRVPLRPAGQPGIPHIRRFGERNASAPR